jgi:hypothetical protein
MMRFAAGNDHGGTIYSAGVAAAAAMLELIDMHAGDPRCRALAVLLDWWLFDPEPGYEQYRDGNDNRVDLVGAIQDTVLTASSMLERVATDPLDPVGGRMAAELLLCAPPRLGIVRPQRDYPPPMGRLSTRTNQTGQQQPLGGGCCGVGPSSGGFNSYGVPSGRHIRTTPVSALKWIIHPPSWTSR